MIINTDHNVFDEIYDLLFTSRKNENHTRSFSCTIMSAIVASYMLQFKEELFIIDSQNHSVIFDGTSTWDLALGIVFENYKYPNLDIPTYKTVPAFKSFFCQKNFNNYYTKDKLLAAAPSLSLKKIQRM